MDRANLVVVGMMEVDISVSMCTPKRVAFSSINNDPCYNYESLDRPWRATTERGLEISDIIFSWNGWYRLYHYGMNIQMPESCVNASSCNSYTGLTLNGPHPQIEDGVVIHVSTVTQADHTTPSAMITGSSFTMSDPCSNYNILDEYWRNTHNYWYWYGYINEHDDTRVKWDGWYRLFLNGLSAQMPDWCVSYMSCGGFSSLWLAGSHPGVEDGVVTREVHGSHYNQCSRFTSNPIQVKACPGDYYVYKFTRPSLAIAGPSYCAVSFSTPSVDPCDSYTSLDHSWRATNYPVYNYNFKCDYNVKWNGWYRLFLDGQSTQMSESCVGQEMCGTYYPMWLKDPHPQLEDGVVTRHVCVSSWNGCCGWESHPIQVKACPGNYYVYEFVKPMVCAAYCAEGNTTLPIQTTAETPPTESLVK
nr:uncharacterized protein LOC129420655 [Misgurnus anguillicaudatus]